MDVQHFFVAMNLRQIAQEGGAALFLGRLANHFELGLCPRDAALGTLGEPVRGVENGVVKVPQEHNRHLHREVGHSIGFGP